jgi:hypothetical protein
MARRKSKKSEVKKVLDIIVEDIYTEINKAVTDALVYGIGTIQIDSNAQIKHVPYRKLIE